jgi:hypothetical protein
LLASALAQARAQPAATASEEDRAVLYLDVPRCVTGPFDGNALLRLLAIELLAERIRIVNGVVGAANPELTVEIGGLSCESEIGQVSVRLRSGAVDVVERQLSLLDLPTGARPRALALAIAELVRETRLRRSGPAGSEVADETLEPAIRGVAGAEASHPSPAPIAQSARPQLVPIRKRGPELQASGDWRLHTASKTSLFGASLAGTVSLRARLDLRLEVSGHWTTLSDPIGAVGLQLYSVGWAALVHAGDAPAIVLGPRLELGFGRTRGTPRQPNVEGREGGQFIALGSIVAGIRPALGGRWSALLELEAGLTLSGLEARADDRTVGAIGGFFGGGRLGVAIAP